MTIPAPVNRKIISLLTTTLLLTSALLAFSVLTSIASTSAIYCASPEGHPEASGECWEDPFDLHTAFAIAEPNDEVWIRQGVYSPGDDEHSSFYLPDGVRVLGGYTGNQADPAERDPDPANTVLDGEDRHYTVLVAAGIQDSALNGVTIRGGAATLIANDAIDIQRRGGGVYVSNSSVTFQNMVIANNRGRFGGGGVYVDEGSSTVFRGVTFQGNSTTHPQSGRGGGMRIRSGEATLIDVTFRFNEAVRGGGLFVDAGTVTIRDSLFAENRVSQGGGGVSVYAGELVVEDSRLVFNEAAEDGGGIYVSRAATGVTLEGVDLTGNRAGVAGGGGWIQSSIVDIERSDIAGNHAVIGPGGGLALGQTNASIVNTRIQGNQAERGGGISIHNSDARLINLLLTGNAAMAPEEPASVEGLQRDEAERESLISDPWRHLFTGEIFPSDYLLGDQKLPRENAGGALLITGRGSTGIVNGTVAGNRGGAFGAAIYRIGDNTAEVLNSIVYRNKSSPDEIPEEHGAHVFSEVEPEATTRLLVDTGLLEGGCPVLHGVVCRNVRDENPRFLAPADPDEAPTSDGDFGLWFTSPGVDAGDAAFLAPEIERDVHGNERIVQNLAEPWSSAGSALDLGAVESPNSPGLIDTDLAIEHYGDTVQARIEVRSDGSGDLSGAVDVVAEAWGFHDVVLGRLTSSQEPSGVTRRLHLDGTALLDDGRLAGFMVEAEFSANPNVVSTFRVRLDTGESTGWQRVAQP